MATVAQIDQVKTTTAGNKSTATAAPTLGDLIVVFAHNSGRTEANAPTISDNNPVASTYTQIAASTKSTSADSMLLFIRNDLIKNTTTTIYTSTQSGDTGGGLIVFRVTGMSRAGPSAVRQTGEQNNQSAGTPSITMGTAIRTDNPVIGCVHTSQSGTTNTAPPSGWPETGDSGYSTPSTGIEQATRDSGETNTTIAWTAATTSNFSALLVELESQRVVKRSPYPQLLAH